MADQEWLESADFIVELIGVAQELKRTKGVECDTGEVVVWLYGLLKQARQRATQVERTAAAGRTQSDALKSATILVEGAYSQAARRYDRRVEKGCMDESYRAKFCSVWPFCSRGY